MSDNILADCGKIKEIVVKCKGTPAQKLLAILMQVGIDDVAELAAMMGVTERYVRKARNQSSEAEPEFRNQSSENGTGVPEKRNQSSAEKKVSPTPPSKNNNYHLETSVERITGRATLAFEGRYVQLESELVDKLPSIYPKLSFPGDLIAADSWLFVDTKGKIDFSAQDDRICRLHTYLAKRNRETAAGAAKAAASTDPAQSDMAAAIARRKARAAQQEAAHG